MGEDALRSLGPQRPQLHGGVPQSLFKALEEATGGFITVIGETPRSGKQVVDVPPLAGEVAVDSSEETSPAPAVTA